MNCLLTTPICTLADPVFAPEGRPGSRPALQRLVRAGFAPWLPGSPEAKGLRIESRPEGPEEHSPGFTLGTAPSSPLSPEGAAERRTDAFYPPFRPRFHGGPLPRVNPGLCSRAPSGPKPASRSFDKRKTGRVCSAALRSTALPAPKQPGLTNLKKGGRGWVRTEGDKVNFSGLSHTF
jgi:hypothetical protein